MEAVPTREPVEGRTRPFETATAHATPRIPVAGPFQRAGSRTFATFALDPAFGSGPIRELQLSLIVAVPPTVGPSAILNVRFRNALSPSPRSADR
jgi:hypothetical protein